jgi:SAM-dependent methyltransferase
MNLLESIHGRYVHTRRVRVLAERLAPLIPQGASVLDIGCGDGRIDELILSRRTDLRIKGLETRLRAKASTPVEAFDGRTIPLADKSVDVGLLIDVLHHAEDPQALLREASRVCGAIVIKDHFRQGLLAEATLRFMDRIGNRRHEVPLPHHYWTVQQWERAFADVELKPVVLEKSLGLYPWPASMIFERSLHFIARLEGQ